MNYKVYQGSELKQTVTSKTAVMNGLQPNQTYEFGVEPDNVTNLLLGTAQPFSMTGTNTTNQCAYAYTLINGYNVLSLVSKFGTQFTVSFDWSVSGSSPSGSFYPQWGGLPWNSGGLANPIVVSSSNTSGHASYNFSENPDSENLAAMFGFRLDNFVGTITFTNLKLLKGSSASTSVTTRGIRFNIPKTLTVGSTITLRYEEYPLGTVPIGNEPSGMFGGGNKQNLSAKVISTANGSSVVEVAGNVIEVGGKNLLQMSNTTAGYVDGITGGIAAADSTVERVTDFIEVEPNQTYWMQDKVNLVSGQYPWVGVGIYDGDKTFIRRDVFQGGYATDNVTVFNTLKIVMPNNAKYVRVSPSTYGNSIDKFELGDQVTPYASFVDGDTFTAQPDGTFALFSEYKALYY